MEMKKQKIDTMQNSREAVMDNKELILKSALDLFYAKGYDACLLYTSDAADE